MAYRFLSARYVWATAITIVFILYGSLTPFHWYAGAASNPFLYLLSRWDTPAQTPAGFVANIALYLPLGLFIALALGPGAGLGRRLGVAGVIGAALCISVELIQVYDWSRQSTLTDVYLNVLGALLGAGLAHTLPLRLQKPIGDLRQPVALALLGAFFVIELYPFIPTLNVRWYDDALASLWRHPQIHADAFVLALLHWLLAGALVARLFGERDGRIAGIVLASGVFVGQIVMLDIWLSISEWSAALVAALILSGLSAIPESRRALLLCAVLLAGQTFLILGTAGHGAPVWRFAPAAGRFAIADLRRIVATFYLVGGSVWLAGVAGLAGRRAGALVAAVLAIGIAVAITGHIGRPAPVDILVALACGLVFAAADLRRV